VTPPGSALRLLGLATLTGLALPLAFSIWRVPWLAWIAVVPLLLAARRSPPRQAALLGLVSGLLTDALGVHWLLGSGVSPGAFCILIAIAASKYALFGLGVSLAYRYRPAAAALAVPTLWVALEWLRANLGWLSIPWGLLGYSQYEVAPLLRTASVAGVYGVSFVLLVGNVLVAELCEHWSHRVSKQRSPTAARIPALALSACLAAAALGLGNAAAPPAGPPPDFRLAVIQAGVYDPAADDVWERNALFERYMRLTREAAQGAELDLVIWPESSVPVAFPYDRGAVGMLFRLAEEIDAHLLVAASGRDKMSRTGRQPQVANSAFLIGPERKIEGRYDKVRLLPFDEYVPLRDWISWPTWITPVRHDATPGSQPGALEISGVRFGVQICFESLFASEGRRTAKQDVDFLVSLTNETFAVGPTSHELLFAMNLFRAAENGLPVVRATTTTISAVIAADGSVLQRSNGSPDVIIADLPAATAPTLYARFGDWTLLALVCLSLGALIIHPQPNASSRLVPWPAGADSGGLEL